MIKRLYSRVQQYLGFLRVVMVGALRQVLGSHLSLVYIGVFKSKLLGRELTQIFFWHSLLRPDIYGRGSRKLKLS